MVDQKISDLVAVTTAPDAYLLELANPGVSNVKITVANFIAQIIALGSGDVVGPASATDNAVVRYDGATGKLVQNSSVFIDDSGNLGVGTATPAGMLEINTKLSTNKALIVKAAASQTANLQEWQDSSGTVGARVTSNQEFSNNQSQTQSEAFGENAVVSANRAVAIGYNASAGANGVAIGWTASNTSGGVSIGDGSESGSNGLAVGIGSRATNSSSIGFGPYATGGVHGVSVGYGATTGTYSVAIGRSAIANHTDAIAIGRGATTTTNNQLVFGAPTFEINDVVFAGGEPRFTLDDATKSFKIRGSASQTANLQEWQNSAGTVLAHVDASGDAKFVNKITLNDVSWQRYAGLMQTINKVVIGTGIVDNNVLLNLTTGLGLGGIACRAPSAGTNEFFFIKNYFSTDRHFSIDSDGRMSLNTGVSPSGALIEGHVLNSSEKGIVVKAAASQTANLTEWQDSTGTIKANFNSLGQLRFQNQGLYDHLIRFGNGYLRNDGTIAATTFVVETGKQPSLTGTSFRGGDTYTIGWTPTSGISDVIDTALNRSTGGGLLITAPASAVTTTIKGAPSQAANLQEWQNSASTVLSGIAPDGDFIVENASANKPQFRLSGYETGMMLTGNDQINFVNNGITNVAIDNSGASRTFSLAVGVVFGWGSSATAAGIDSGLSRNTAGVIEINNGTAGTFRDLKLRNINITQSATFNSEVDNGNSSTADTIDWTTGNKHKSTLTDNCTYTFTAPSGPTNLILKLTQDGTGSRIVTWPAACKWPGGTAPTLSTAANAVDIVSFYYDGSTYWGQVGLNFS